jgi:uncharacterized repeat protein (TIGR03806 family)
VAFVAGGTEFIEGSEEILIRLDNDEYGIHTNDAMMFGPDGMLYVGLGDGGPQGRGGGDHALDLNDLRGKILRLDVSMETGFAPAPGNPFIEQGSNAALVYSYGLRNPWRFSFDRGTGVIWIGDVGNNTFEEINRATAPGQNFGWGVREGFECTWDYSFEECQTLQTTLPLLAYQHGSGPKEGNSVTGGVVYRGTDVPSLTGSYVFADFISAKIWSVSNVDALGPDAVAEFEPLYEGVAVSSFGEDQNGELFVVDFLNGKVLGVAGQEGMSVGGPPGLLSETGCFDAAAPENPLPALIPYDVASPLWSDGAAKRRWFALPNETSISTESDGDFTFPEGSVLVKEFSSGGQRLETRFLVRDALGWWGYTYRWNLDQSDATLVGPASETAQFSVGDWTYPSRSQCMQCHTPAAGFSLGLEAKQLNTPFSYPGSTEPENQIAALQSIGVLNQGLVLLPALPTPADPATGSVEDRARSYLHSNCSGCHRPGGPTNANINLRSDVPFSATNLCNAPPVTSDLGIPGALLFKPGVAQESILAHRVDTTVPAFRMPPIARTVTDPMAAQLIWEWVDGRSDCENLTAGEAVPFAAKKTWLALFSALLLSLGVRETARRFRPRHAGPPRALERH